MRVTHLNGLKALEVTLRAGSFRAAADELGVTTAAVGQHLDVNYFFVQALVHSQLTMRAGLKENSRRVFPRSRMLLAN
jgi:LysR family glycine cleavage system transcriptional activator